MEIPVLRPLLPTADRLLPYLRRIDGSRIYGNWGPLVTELAERLGARWGLTGDSVVPAANGTVVLAATLATAAEDRPGLCLMPSWTFVATAHAAMAAGLTPYLADVDEGRWHLTPDLAEQAILSAPGPVRAVVPVCPFGAPLDWRGWEEFHAATGIPVVIDAAAAFDSLAATTLPAILSLHATKALGIGEGGALVSPDPDLAGRVRQRLNFGFRGSRIAQMAGGNGKMSEYHAATGLAALEEWPRARLQFAVILTGLARAMAAVPGVAVQPGCGDEWVSSTFSVRLPVPAPEVGEGLAVRGIETRQWWESGLHAHPAFAHCPRTDLPATARLARQVIGLPCWRDMPQAAVTRIASALAAELAESYSPAATSRR